MDKFDLLKSEIKAYTKKSGAFVGAHSDKRAAKASKKPAFIMGGGGKPHTFHHWDTGDEIKDYQGYAVSHSEGKATHWKTGIEPNGERSWNVVGEDEAFQRPGTTGLAPPQKSISASSVEVQGADRYEYTNGKKPSGSGASMFSPHKDVDFSKHKEGEDYVKTPHLPYAEAKKHAQKWAAGKGHRTIHVQT